MSASADAEGASADRVRFVLGLLIAFLVPLLLGEAYARLKPPSDVLEHLGEDSPAAGIYRPDPVLGADYRSYEEFRAAYSARLAALGPLDSDKPTWAFFGNSFAQAPGMLAETAQAALPDHRIFYLARNEPLYLRVAQARLLLEQGLRPERIFFVLLPLDMSHIGKQPLSALTVTRNGAITHRVRMPGPPLDAVLDWSRLATVAWIRSGRHVGDPSFRLSAVTETMSPRLSGDLRRLLGVLGDLSRKFAVPVTVVGIPNREQIFGKAGWVFQDTVAGLARESGLDWYDARRVFLGEPDKPSLFLPDWHFTPRGNGLLLDGLQAHLRGLGTVAGTAAREGAP